MWLSLLGRCDNLMRLSLVGRCDNLMRLSLLGRYDNLMRLSLVGRCDTDILMTLSLVWRCDNLVRLSLVGRRAVPGVERGCGARVGQRLRGRDSHPLGPHLPDSRLHSAVRNKNLHRLAVYNISDHPSPQKKLFPDLYLYFLDAVI
jgi:hypothetical protein